MSKKYAASVPASMIQLSELLAKEVSEISGVNEELLGSAQDDKAGVLSMLRQGAGLTTLQNLFDQLDRSQRILGKIIIDIIQANFTPGKIKKILEDQEPTEQFYNKSFGRYNAAIEDGLNTQTQRQMQFIQMLQLRQAGIPITTEDLLESATIQNKKQIIENAIAQEQQQQEAQQMQLELEAQDRKAQMMSIEARARADLGLAAERTSRVDENRALAIERIHEANAQDEKALLDKVKALKELEQMDLGHIQQLLSMANELRNAEARVAEAGVDRVTSAPRPEEV